MKKILLLLPIMIIMTGCAFSQTQTANDTNINQNIQEIETVVNTSWLINELTRNFAEHDFILQEIDFQEIDKPETKILGFSDSNVSVILYDKNHEIYGNQKEFDNAISRYGTDEYYGEILLQEKQIHSDVLLKYTKTAVMANHGAMQKEYFFTLPNNEMLKVKIRFPSDPEIDDSTQKELIWNRVNEIHKILLTDL
jgi:hypothetical protein